MATLTGKLWGVSPSPRRVGELLTRNDVCHLHTDRSSAETCGARFGRTPDLVSLDQIRPHVFEVTWSLSSAADGRLRRRS